MAASSLSAVFQVTQETLTAAEMWTDLGGGLHSCCLSWDALCTTRWMFSQRGISCISENATSAVVKLPSFSHEVRLLLERERSDQNIRALPKAWHSGFVCVRCCIPSLPGEPGTQKERGKNIPCRKHLGDLFLARVIWQSEIRILKGEQKTGSVSRQRCKG